MAAGAERTREAYLWSNFSHNVSGLILLGTSLFALVGLACGARWYRHWPLGFVALAVFVYLRAAANEGVWPMGPTPGLARRRRGTPARHGRGAGAGARSRRVARAGACSRSPRCPTSCPCSAGAGGVLAPHAFARRLPEQGELSRPGHALDDGRARRAAGRVALARAPADPPASRCWAGVAASLAMVGIALVLVFYREANLTLDP